MSPDILEVGRLVEYKSQAVVARDRADRKDTEDSGGWSSSRGVAPLMSTPPERFASPK